MGYTTHFFDNIGFVLSDMPAELFESVRQECLAVYSDPELQTRANHTLAGAIDTEYFLTKSMATLEPYLDWLIAQYDEHFKYTHTVDNTWRKGDQWAWQIDSLWANYQKKHEFNPVHNHGGTLSFVIWVQIPYDLEEEVKQSKELNDYPKTTSCFQFLAINTMGQIYPHTLPVDKTWQGKIIMFPAKMMHTVYPFYTSDEYRISVAGNVTKKVMG
jgi:hypothetical protein